MSYRQDLIGFGEPKEGYWDGFQRINTDTKIGGIIGVFRQGAIESKRVVTIRGLDDENKYAVKTLDGKIITTQTGHYLSSVGFEVHLNNEHDGDLFESNS